jgi:multidrug resistance efflux pump
MFGSMRMIMIGVMVAGLAGAGAYVFKLRADNATLKANAIKLESAISDQKQLIENQQKDFKEILNANNQMNKLVEVLKKENN